MSGVAIKTLELLEEELGNHKAAIKELEGIIALIKSARKSGVAAGTTRTTTSRAVGASRIGMKGGKRSRKGSYVSVAEQILRKSNSPMRMVDLVKEISKVRPGSGKYSVAAARQAITNAAKSDSSAIVRVGPERSGLYSVSPN